MLLSTPKTVLFYSFKGGVGRTMTMLNCAKHLSKNGKKILMVDFDLYAPGLSFWKINSTQKNEDEKYFLNFLVDDFNGKDDNKKIYKKYIDENLYLVPIYDMSNISAYHKLLIELSAFLFDIKSKANKKISSNSTLSDIILDTITTKLIENEKFDYIFFDARTGLTEVSDILFSSRVDLKVFISACNRQNINGINSVLNLIKNQKHSILRVLSLIPDINHRKIELLKSESNLDDDLKLKKNFQWYDVMGISYYSDIVLNDFELWEKLEDEHQYKIELKDIANKIEDIIYGEKFEL